MSEVIRKWIADRMGILLDGNVYNFGQLIKDGNLISQILCSYGIIKTEDVCPVSQDFSICYTNLNCLTDALKTLGIYLSDATVQILARGDGPQAYKFFYKLYLVLHDKSKVNFILKTKLEEKLEEIPSAPSSILKTGGGGTGVPNYDSTKALYQWHKNNYLNLQKQNEKTRSSYLKKFQTEINASDLDPKELDENNCRDIEKRLQDMFHNIHEPPVDLSEEPPQPPGKLEMIRPNPKEAKSYLRDLKERHRKSQENKILQTYMHKLLLSDFQTKYKNKQDLEFNQAVLGKVLRQSYYEKQMASKLLEVYNQKDRVIENRKMVNKMIEVKRDQTFVAELTSSNYNVTLASLKDYNERKRILELHRRLYDEKMRRKFLRHYEICWNIMRDAVNLSIRTSEYVEKYETSVPEYVWRNWMTLFINEQKLLTKPVILDEVLSCIEEEESSEYYRQSYLDEEDIDNYIKQENGWFLEELEIFYLSLSDIIKLGENILCHIVNKLLLVKYPKPPLPRCPNLPAVTTACALIGLENDSHMKILQKILTRRGIIVINEKEVTNYCLQCFHNEHVPMDVDENLDAETQKGKKALKGGGKKPPPMEIKKGEKQRPSELGGIATSQKETQTPKYFPDEEVKLSPAAQLGQAAYECLNLGLEINNYLFTKMLIEYLKKFKTMKGWVLVNYPEKLADAMTLELALTGREIKSIVEHIEDDMEEEEEQEESFTADSYHRSASEMFAPPEDIYLLKRVSKLCPLRGVSLEPEPYHSYLTSFIRLTHATPERASMQADASKIGFTIEEYTKVERFYEQLKCKSSLVYKDFDAETVRDIVNIVLQDNVFGFLIFNDIIQVVFDCMEEKRKQEEERRSISKNKKKEEKKVVPPEPPKKPKSIMINLPRVSVIEEQPPRPGEDKWEYVDLPLPSEFQKQLASFWEDIELTYLNDFRQIFFQFRLAKNSLIPYYHNVYSHMTSFITRPDNKQEYLHRFQITFNDLENDLREDNEFKTELHCRIMDFRSKLWEICICRMRESEDERLRNIQENWYTELCVEVVNLFVSSMQLEIDRFASTMQLLTDYYTFMATNELSITKYNKNNLSSYQIDEKLIIYVREAYININNKIQKTPFTSYMNGVLKNTLQFVNQTYQMATASTTVMTKLIQEPKVPKKKPIASKTSAQEPGDSATNLKNLISLNSEWAYALEGEYARAKFRLTLLEARACLELDEIVLQGEKLYHGIYEKLDKRNQDELQSVNLACEIFHRATESSESVQPRLVISGAKFYMDGKEIMYNDVYQPMLPYLDETTMEIFYTIPQLHKLTKIFLDLAPNGSLPFKTFTFLMEDLVVHQSDTGLTANSLLPLYWHHLSTEQLQDVLDKIFGDVEYINWKDFIIYNLELPFPTEQELLDVREQFRHMDPDKLEYVNEVQFQRVNFWFEHIELIRQTFTGKSIKSLLATMFEIRTDCINYSALLLTFCKDQDPIIGVAKAFGLCIGKQVCWNLETGLNYIEILRYQKFMDQEKNVSVISEVETQSNYSETKFPSNADFPKEQEYTKESFENVSEAGVESLFVEDESVEEEEVSTAPSLCYVLPFNIILTIMTAALPWHTRVQCVQDKSLKEFLEVIYENCRNEEFQLVFTHDFLNNEDFKNYITNNYKFNVRSPASFVQMKIEKCFCKKETLSESDK